MAKKRGPDNFISRLFTRHRDLRKIEGRRAREMSRVMREVKGRALSLIDRNMTTFREAGEYIDSAAAVSRAQQTVSEIDSLMRQRADWATTNVLSMRQEAWTQGVSDIEFAAQRLPGGLEAQMQASFGQVFPEAGFSAIEHPVLGIAPDAMFNGVRAGTTQGVRDVLVNAVVSGESVQETGRRLSEGLDISIAAGERIARTNVNAAYNEAQRAVYEANSDIIAGYAWEATLDDRTTQICFMLHGQFWPTGSNTPGPPAHWNCRSILIPVFKDPAVQGVLDATPRRARDYDKQGRPHDVLVRSSTTPEEWARRQPTEITHRITGSKLKNSLFRRKLIGFDDIVDPSLRVRTDQEIIRRAAGLHPGNAQLQRQARAMEVRRIPSQRAIRRSDSTLARAQPWAPGQARADEIVQTAMERAYRKRTTDLFIRGPASKFSEEELRDELEKLSRRYTVVNRASKENAAIVRRLREIEKEFDRRGLSIVAPRKRYPILEKPVRRKVVRRAKKAVPKPAKLEIQPRTLPGRKILSRDDMIEVTRERMASGELPEIPIREVPFEHLTGSARKTVYADYHIPTRSIRVNTLADDAWSTIAQDTSAYYKRGFWSSAAPTHVLDHEIGHGVHVGRFLLRRLTSAEAALVRKHVSRYAAKSTHEFVAEVYAARVDGKTFPKAIMDLYRQFKGI